MDVGKSKIVEPEKMEDHVFQENVF